MTMSMLSPFMIPQRVVQGKRKVHAKDGSQPWKAKNKAKKSAGDCVDGSSGLEARCDRSRLYTPIYMEEKEKSWSMVVHNAKVVRRNVLVKRYIKAKVKAQRGKHLSTGKVVAHHEVKDGGSSVVFYEITPQKDGGSLVHYVGLGHGDRVKDRKRKTVERNVDTVNVVVIDKTKLHGTIIPKKGVQERSLNEGKQLF
ncbi:unnamed protein product [Vicia faba]|uniref:Uncharacterized protein n=1 Tax=Vicia faba TaxID=3906 RepID=A0AAV1A4Z1_VICFA|nr:unnamed protein product [Vicia faba]